MNESYTKTRDLFAARANGKSSIVHNLAVVTDYDYVTGKLGGEMLLKKKYPEVYQMLQNTRKSDSEKSMSSNTRPSCGGKSPSGLSDAMNIRTLNFHPLTTLETCSCMDMIEENPSMSIIGSLIDVANRRDVTGFAEGGNNTSYLKKSIIVPSAQLIKSRERRFRSEATFYWTEQNEVGKKLLRSKTEITDAVKVIGGSQLVKSMDVKMPMPVRHKGGSVTTIYYNRKGTLDDSAWDTYYENVSERDAGVEIWMPFYGSATFTDGYKPTPVIDRNRDFQLYLENVENGVAAFNPAQLSKVSLEVSGQTISWKFPVEWKTTIAKNALTGAKKLIFYCKMNILTETGISVPLVIQSSDVSHSDPSYVNIPTIDIFWGCLAKDTLITMANGARQPICQVRVGDFVKTRHGISVVKEMISGKEKKIYLIKTSKGNIIRLTAEHPLMTPTGPRLAKTLTYGDALEMDYGIDTITEMYPTEYDDLVYSLRLNEEEYIAAQSFYAGDFSAQNTEMSATAPKKQASNQKLEPFQEEMNELIHNLQKEKEGRYE